MVHVLTSIIILGIWQLCVKPSASEKNFIDLFSEQLYTFGFSRTSSSWVVNRETFHFSREIKIAMSSASDTGPSEHFMLGMLGNLPQSLMLPLWVLHAGEPAVALKLPLRALHAGAHAENSSTLLISFKIRQIATTMHLINKILRGRVRSGANLRHGHGITWKGPSCGFSHPPPTGVFTQITRCGIGQYCAESQVKTCNYFIGVAKCLN